MLKINCCIDNFQGIGNSTLQKNENTRFRHFEHNLFIEIKSILPHIFILMYRALDRNVSTSFSRFLNDLSYGHHA